MTERCYNCGKEEKITKGVSDIEKVEVDLGLSRQRREVYAIISKCVKKGENRELKDIEAKCMRATDI